MPPKIPNLDVMTKGELLEFWKRYLRPSRVDARMLVGDERRGYINIASRLAKYAINKAAAIRAREGGRPDLALERERAANRIHEMLPDDVVW